MKNSSTWLIHENIAQLPAHIGGRESSALRSYLKYLTIKSTISDEEADKFRKNIPSRQSKADNYIP